MLNRSTKLKIHPFIIKKFIVPRNILKVLENMPNFIKIMNKIYGFTVNFIINLGFRYIALQIFQ
jgi:hypothetical protein